MCQACLTANREKVDWGSALEVEEGVLVDSDEESDLASDSEGNKDVEDE